MKRRGKLYVFICSRCNVTLKLLTMQYHHARVVSDLPHRSLSNGDVVTFTDGETFEVEGWQCGEGVWFYILRKLLKRGGKGKSHWVVTYTTKNGLRAAPHRK